PIPHVAPDDRRQRPQGRGPAGATRQGRAAARRAAGHRRRSARACGRGRSRGETAGGPRATVADAAGGVSAAGPAGTRVRRDRGGPVDYARRCARALPPRRQTVEGVPGVNEHELEKLAQRLGARAAEQLDVERTAQAVVTRLREAPRVSVVTRLWMQSAWLKVAATVVLLLGTGAVTKALWRRRSGRRSRATRARSPTRTRRKRSSCVARSGIAGTSMCARRWV